jgi:hypothetical protein
MPPGSGCSHRATGWSPSQPEPSDDHVAAICRILDDHEVEFVILGGLAARLHARGHTTIDVDICPSLYDANPSNLPDALRNLGARLQVKGDLLAWRSILIRPCCTMLR